MNSGALIERSAVVTRLKETDHYLKPEELAYFLNLDPETVRGMSRERKIPALKIGNRWRYDPKAIIDWLESSGG